MQVETGRPFLREVALREALMHDLPSFLVGILLLFMLACLASLVVLVGWLGAPPPKESPVEIILGVLLIAGAVFAFLRYRAHRLTSILKDGEPVAAEVLRGLAHQFFVQIRLRYAIAGRDVQAHLWLPNTRRPRALSRVQRLSLAVPRGARGVVVRELYP